MDSDIPYTNFENEYQLIGFLVEKTIKNQENNSSEPSEEIDTDQFVKKNEIQDLKKDYRELKQSNEQLMQLVESLTDIMEEKGFDNITTSEKEVEEEEEDVEDIPEMVECPDCGEEFHVDSIGGHMGAYEDHRNLAEVFQNDNGRYVCAVCGKEMEKEKQFYNHVDAEGYSLGKLLAVHRDSVLESEEESGIDDMFDKDGNFKLSKRKKPDNYSMEELGNLYRKHIEEEGVAKSIHDFLDEVFDIDAETGEKPYYRSYNALEDNEDFESDKGLKGHSKVYFTNRQQYENRINNNSIESVKEKIGERRFQVLKLALSKLLPAKGNTKYIKYTDFVGEFPGDEEVDPEDVWEDLFVNEDVRRAIKSSVNEELRMQPDRKGYSRSPRTWELEVSVE